MSLLRVSLWLSLLCCLSGRAPAENISRALPAGYEKTLAPLLTPLEPLLAQKPGEAAKESGGEILIYERIVQVQEDGRRLAVNHWSSRAVTEAGTGPLERDSDSFHRKRQKVYLAKADTITPDGKRLPVRDDAAFIQTPQRSADSSLFDDYAEAVVIYPDVKPGSSTELVLVTEDVEARIPGQFTGTGVFTTAWPAGLMRQVVEMPRTMADRLTITALGNVPAVKREEVEGGARVRFTWEVKSVKAEQRETNRPPLSQTGPCVFLTTLRSWEEFMQWYWPQVEPRLAVGDALKSRVEEWTKDAKSRTDIIAALLKRASDDVRYTALEFADGDLVPRPVNQTWENQYGDCKDKACLLAAMLKVKGIKAHPALINTDFPGRVERRSPDFRHFDHCIVAVEREGGGWIFCDPTVPGLLPGMIGAADGDRDVLLVKRDVEWARTPVHEWGTMRFRIEAEMDAAGGLSGWCRIEAEGNDAASQAWQESKDTREELLDRMREFLTGFAEEIRAVDVKKYPDWKPGQPWKLDVYFLVPGAGAESVTFLGDRNYVPDTGDRRERKTLWPLWRERIESTALIKLPPGRVPDRMPSSYKTTSRYADAEASWEWKDGTATGTFLLVTKENAVTPADWQGFTDQMTAFSAWLDRPLALKEGDTPGPATPADELQGFALMPSVEGQINLVEEKYPTGGNAKLRRAALEKAITLFPGDRRMLLCAGWRLASLDITEKRPADALRRLDGFLESCRSAAPVEEAGTADFMRSLALRDSNRVEEAMAVWKKQADDASLGGFRRTHACWQIARQQLKTDKAAGIATLEKGMALRAPDAEHVLYPDWIKARFESGEHAQAAKILQTLVADRPDDAPGILASLIDYNDDLTTEQNRALTEMLRGLGKPEDFGEKFASLLEATEARIALAGIAEKLRERAAAEITAHAKAFEGIQLPPELKTPDDFSKAAEELNDRGSQPGRAVRYMLEALARCEEGDDSAERLWDYCRFAEWWSRAAPGTKTKAVVDSAFALADLLPAVNAFSREARILEAKLLIREDKLAEAKAHLEPIAALTLPDDAGKRIVALQYLEKIAEAEARWDDAMKIVAELMETTPAAAARAAWHAACICLVRQQWDEAFTWIGRLREMPENARKAAPFHEQIQLLLDFAADREEAMAWWKNAPAWWETWLKEMQKAAPKKRVKDAVIAEIEDVEQLGASLRAVAGAGDMPAAIGIMHSLASAARVHPYYMFEFTGIVTNSDTVPEFKKVSPWCIPVTKAARPVFPQKDRKLLRQWLLSMVSIALTGKDYKGCGAAAKEFMAVPHDPDELTARAAVLWLAGAADGNLLVDEALDAGKRVFEGGHCPEEIRPNLIFLIAYAMERSKKSEESGAFLDKHLASIPEGHPILVQGRAQLDMVKAKKTKPAPQAPLRREGISPASYVKWVDQLKLPWFDYMEPHSLDDPRLADPAKAVRAGGNLLLPLERTRAVWLLAKAGKFPASEPYALVNVTNWILYTFDTDAAIHRALNSVMSADGWPERDRSAVLKSAVSRALQQNALRRLKPWLQFPAAQSPPDDYKEQVAALRIMAGVDPSSVDSLKKAADALEFKEDAASTDSAAAFLTHRLCQLGEFSVAKALIEKQRAAGNATDTYRKMVNDDLSEYLKNAEFWRPVNEALRNEVMKAFPECAGMEEPVEILRVAGGVEPDQIIRQDAATARRLFLWAVKQRTFDCSTSEFWTSIMNTGELPPLALRRALAETFVKAAPPETGGEGAVQFFGSLFDVDNPEERQLSETVLAPLRGKPGLPGAVTEAIKAMDLMACLRAGLECDPLKVLGTLEIPLRRSMTAGRVLDAAVSRGDRAMAKSVFDVIPRERLHSAGLLPHALAAWKLAGDDAAWKEGAAVARKHVREMLVHGWPSRNPRPILIAVTIAATLDEPDLIPATLLPDCERWLRNELLLTQLRVRIAALKSDWAACAEHAGRAAQQFPTWHEFNYFHGLACHRLGRKDEARTSLEAFLRVVHNEPECATARAMLDKAGK